MDALCDHMILVRYVWSTSILTVLTHTVSSNRVQRSLAVEALNHWTTYKDHASVSYVQFKGRKTHSRRYDNDIDTEHEIETTIPRSHFMATPTSVGHVCFTLRLREN